MKGTKGSSTHEPVLTLKNLYRLLTQKDYPFHSYRVFPDQVLRGVSLLKYWYSFFGESLPEGMDLSIFDPEGGRNRNTSRLMNRSGSEGLMDAWFNELSGYVNRDFFVALTRAWQSRLTQWHYNSQVLTDRLQRFATLIRERNDLATAELGAFLTEVSACLERKSRRGREEPPILFRQSMVLSWMTLYALYGTRQQDEVLERLRLDARLAPPMLYSLMSRQEEVNEPEVISTRSCVLCVQPLSDRAYFGNRELLEETVRWFSVPGCHRLIVSGIGGSGKTEFVRQLLNGLVHSRGYRRIAFVQYEESLAGSLASAFPVLRNVNASRRVSEARLILEEGGAGRTLLLIDNVNRPVSQDPELKALAAYGCDAIITSRNTEIDGFRTLQLSGVDPESGRKMFLYYLSRETDQLADVDQVCGFVACHPLTIRLLANLCRFRFWTVATLRERLKKKGLVKLSYIREASPVNLEKVFEDTFDMSGLSDEQIRLLRLVALLPYRYWLSEELFPYSGDVCGDPNVLTDLCRSLGDLGWLMTGDGQSFAMHPLIAEVIRVRPVNAEDFPGLWRYMEEAGQEPEELKNRVLISLILRTGGLDARAIGCLAWLERNISFYPYIALPEQLYEKHRQYLDTHAHSDAEEADYWLGLGMRDLVIRSSRERLEEYLNQIRALKGGLKCVSWTECRNTLMDFVCEVIPAERSDRLFEEIRPEDQESEEMVLYLISLSEKQRSADHDPKRGLQSLEEADRLLNRLGLEHSGRQANVDYRRGTCLLDLGRPAEARPLIARAMQNIREREGRDDTVNMISTRSTYAVTLHFLEDYEAALQEYTRLEEIYRAQRRVGAYEYLLMKNNMAMTLDGLKRFSEAEKAMEEVLEGDRKVSVPRSITASHQRNMALILCHEDKYPQAEPCAAEAVSERLEVFGEGSPWVADARAVHALALWGLGRQEEAGALIEEACRVMNEGFGPSHQKTLLGEEIRRRINGQEPAERK